MDAKDYFEFMSKLTALADQYGLTLANQEGESCKDPRYFDIILEFVCKEYA
jgi:hypothetical protein